MTIKHRLSRVKEYRCWDSMIQRCTNPNCERFKHYGLRGISIYSDWFDFETFYRYVGPAPGPEYTLERLNNYGNYEPGNVRWATKKEQSRNRSDNRILEYAGEKKCLVEWAELFNINPAVVRKRLKRGWTVEKALKTSVRDNGYRK